MMRNRLDRILSENTEHSRSEIKRMIARGGVTLDGVPVTRPETKVDPETVSIQLDGQEIRCGKRYVMMNKPKGVVCATEDGLHRTVLDLLPEAFRRKGMFPAGRLDLDTEGFVLLTDDGAFAHKLLAPKKKVSKTYIARIAGGLCEDVQARFAQGLVLKDGTLCRPAELEWLSADTVRIVLYEGMYHQVKRMVETCGGMVVELRRIRIGGVDLDPSLGAGECRELSAEERVLILGNDGHRQKKF